MDLNKTTNEKQIIYLINDHCPNQAMRNEFQTNTFTLKINKLEIVEKECCGYVVDEGGIFLIASITLHNLSNEILSFSKNDLLISYDKEDPYEAEEYFGVPYQFEDEIALKPNDEVKGKLVYIIAESAKKVTFRYFENYDDDTEKQYKLRYNLDC